MTIEKEWGVVVERGERERGSNALLVLECGSLNGLDGVVAHSVVVVEREKREEQSEFRTSNVEFNFGIVSHSFFPLLLSFSLFNFTRQRCSQRLGSTRVHQSYHRLILMPTTTPVTLRERVTRPFPLLDLISVIANGSPSPPRIQRSQQGKSLLRTLKHSHSHSPSSLEQIPTVAGFLKRQDEMTEDHSAQGERLKQQQEQYKAQQLARAKQAPGGTDSGTEGISAGQSEKDEMMKKARENKQPNAKEFERQGEREVYDPVTGRNVIVRDARLEGAFFSFLASLLSPFPVQLLSLSLHLAFFKPTDTPLLPLPSADFQKPQLFDPKNIDPSNLTAPGPATNIPGGGQQDAPIDQTSPHPIQPTNIHLRPFPPAVDKNSLKTITYTVTTYATAIIAGLGIIWFFAAWRSGWVGFIFISQLIGALAVGIFFAHGLVVKKIEKELDKIRLQMHQDRGEQHSPPTPESVEWLNSFVKVYVTSSSLFFRRY